jgi:multidrug efflux pump subunit AcrB
MNLGPAGRLGRFFIDSKLTPLLVVSSLALGAVAVSLTPREEEPQIVVPVVDLFVGLPGASPEEVEARGTIPLEKRMWEIPGVEYVYSASMPGMSLVTVRFRVGDNEVDSLVKVFEKLTSGLERLQEGFTMPLAKLRGIDDVPVLALTLWGRNADGFALRRLAAELEREVSRLDEVSETRLIGGRRREMRVLLSSQRMAAYGVDPAAVAGALAAQNSSIPAGTFASGDREIRVETGAFLQDAGEVRDLVIGVHGGRPVYLRDVAEVVDGPEEVRDYVFFAAGPAATGGIMAGPGDDVLAPAVTLSVAKRKGSDASRVVDEVVAKVESLKGHLLPPDVNVTVTRDYGETAGEKAGELLTHLMVAIVSVTVVVALFLGWRGGLVVFVSVPITFALTLFVYYVLGYTLNRVTLFALIFVTGIVVDDSIIVVENIVRHLSMRRRPPLQAALEAVNEVGNPTILATLTVIAAVLPMAFVRGLMGPYMRPMPVGASLAMTFSLFIALIAAPWFAYRLVRGEAHGGEEYDLEKTVTYRAYRGIMAPLMRRSSLAALFFAGVVVLLLGSMALFPLKLVTVKMLPFDNKSELQVVIDMPEGTTLETTAHVARDIAAYMLTVPEVRDLELYAGTAAPVNFNGLLRHYDLRQGGHVADLQVNLVHKTHREDQSHDLALRVRSPVQEIARRYGASVKVVEIPPGPPVLATLVAEVYGPSEAARLELAGRIREVFQSTDGVVDVDWSVEARQPKRILKVDREKAALHGVAAAAAGRTLHLALQGEVAGILRDPREAETVSIRLQLPLAERSSVDDLAGVKVATAGGTLVPLAELVDVEQTTEEISRHRKNLRPVIYVTGDVAGTEESPVYAILKMARDIDEIPLPGGAAVEQFYRDQPWSEERPAMKWDGEWHVTYEVFRDLGVAFGLVLILIYMLIIGWFRSFSVPLVMMIAIPLALVGVLPGHWLFGAFFTATSMIGFIALAGIMVRNSVLLIDFVNLAREEGKSLDEAVLAAGAVRFRPILLTAGTVVVGAVVILFDPIFQGLAISLMGGAIASTVLTLVVVPLVHFMVERRHETGRGGPA